MRGEMIMVNREKDLEKMANALLAQHGYAPDGRPFGDKRESVKAWSTPCGGQPGYRKKCKRI